MVEVAALFVRKDSAYKALAGVDAWDVMRNALHWPGGSRVVAHPPCSQWGGLRHMARKDSSEKNHARIAVRWVRIFGGVLEHPKGSSLWDEIELPKPGAGVDSFGGFTLEVDQWWWGHVVNKPTWLYIVRCAEVPEVPEVPHKAGKSDRVVTTGHGIRVGHPGFRSRVTQKEREYTPMAFAQWLVEVARRCSASDAGTEHG